MLSKNERFQSGRRGGKPAPPSAPPTLRVRSGRLPATSLRPSFGRPQDRAIHSQGLCSQALCRGDGSPLYANAPSGYSPIPTHCLWVSRISVVLLDWMLLDWNFSLWAKKQTQPSGDRVRPKGSSCQHVRHNKGPNYEKIPCCWPGSRPNKLKCCFKKDTPSRACAGLPECRATPCAASAASIGIRRACGDLEKRGWRWTNTRRMSIRSSWTPGRLPHATTF